MNWALVETRERPARAPKTTLRVEHRADGQLWAIRGRESLPVAVRRCFPWSDPSRHVSLRDGEDEEFALVDDPAELDDQSRDALERALAEAGFVLEITRILDCEEEVEIRDWKVETRQGARSFQTRRDDWPRPVPGGGLLIRDVAGDLYWVRNPAEMDARSQDKLWAFVD